MNSDHVTPDLAVSAGAARAATRTSARCYATPAPLLEVMEDQLRYLMNHNGRQCYAACAECARLEEVKRTLLRPFA